MKRPEDDSVVRNAWPDHRRNDMDYKRMRDDQDDDKRDGQREDICGEFNPGFNLWTSCHGFRHLGLTRSRCCQVFWVLVILLCVGCLIGCVIYYFYFVFNTSVYSRIVTENPTSREWPTTIICERQVYRLNKINSVGSGFSTLSASLLTWSLGPEYARPEVKENHVNFNLAKNQLDSALAQTRFNTSHDKLSKAIAPNCTQFILECKVGYNLLSGKECCGQIFNPDPIINQFGACYTTVGASEKYQVSGAGEGNGLQVVTLHEDASIYDSSFVNPKLMQSSGVNFAIVDQQSTVLTALKTRGQSVPLGTVASIGISRTVTDNSDLEFSVIGRMECAPSGTTDSDEVDSDFLIGIDTNTYGYTKDNCQNVAKQELLARELMNCTFNTRAGGHEQCSPDQSVTFYRSFIDSNNTSTSKISTVQLTNEVKDRYNKACPQDCTFDRYSVSSSYTPLSTDQKNNYAKTIGETTQNIRVVVLNFYLNSLEYQRIHNFPQSGLQFVAEVGGLMSFFLGMSIISILECFCYLLHCIRHTCCPCCDREDREISEDLPPPKWRHVDRAQMEDYNKFERQQNRSRNNHYY